MNAELSFRQERERLQSDFSAFVRSAWEIVEPNPLVWGWHMQAICMHLEAVRDGEVSRLLMNVPPGMSKSMLTSVMWPAFCWTTQPHLRFLCCSHSLDLALRDSVRCRRLLQSDWYQKRWPIQLVGDQNAKAKFETTSNGFRQAVAAGSVTGARADHFIIDDPHSVESAASEQMRKTTADWFLEAVPTRMNNPAAVYDDEGNVIKPASSIVIIMQRLHEDDVSGLCLSRNLGYTHLMLPMEFEANRKCVTQIGDYVFEDQRSEDGELLFEERFPREVVERDKRVLGPFAYSGQMQQRPAPAGGGIIKREYWQLWDDAEALAQGVNDASAYPPMSYILISADTAYTTRQENDASYITVWGCWDRGGASAKAFLSREGVKLELVDSRDTIPCVMLMWAKELRVPMHGETIERLSGEPLKAFEERQRRHWGIVQWIAHAAKTYNADKILIESKENGITVADEIKRLYKAASWDVELVNPGSVDKVARVYAVQSVFTNSQIWCPDKSWADHLMTQFESFPKAKHDDGVDSTTQAIRWLRDRKFLERQEEIAASINLSAAWKPKTKAVYDV